MLRILGCPWKLVTIIISKLVYNLHDLQPIYLSIYGLFNPFTKYQQHIPVFLNLLSSCALLASFFFPLAILKFRTYLFIEGNRFLCQMMEFHAMKVGL